MDGSGERVLESTVDGQQRSEAEAMEILRAQTEIVSVRESERTGGDPRYFHNVHQPLLDYDPVKSDITIEA